MKYSLYRACLVQLQALIAAKDKPPEVRAPARDAPNCALIMRVRR